MVAILRILDNIINIIPVKMALDIGGIIGQLGYALDRKHRRLAISNIGRVFGKDKTPNEIRNIAKKSFQNLGRNIAEFLRKEPSDFEVQGYENIENLIKQDKPVIYILGHFGNWEMLGRIAARHGIKLTAVGRAMKNKRVDEYIRNKRYGCGLEILDKKGSARGLLKALSKGRSVAILIDQYAGRHGVFVQFFGIPTSTTPSPAVMALRTGAPVVPAFMKRIGHKHKIFIELPVYITKTGNITKDIFTNTQRFIQPLEDKVKKYPEEWWWVHRRWR